MIYRADLPDGSTVTITDPDTEYPELIREYAGEQCGAYVQNLLWHVEIIDSRLRRINRVLGINISSVSREINDLLEFIEGDDRHAES